MSRNKRHNPRPEKICTVCGLAKDACREKLGMQKQWGHIDPRGFSSEAGIRQLGVDTLKGMARMQAGEGDTAELAHHEIRRRAHLDSLTERTPLWALSPYEAAFHRAKGAPVIQSGGYCRL